MNQGDWQHVIAVGRYVDWYQRKRQHGDRVECSQRVHGERVPLRIRKRASRRMRHRSGTRRLHILLFMSDLPTTTHISSHLTDIGGLSRTRNAYFTETETEVVVTVSFCVYLQTYTPQQPPKRDLTVSQFSIKNT